MEVSAGQVPLKAGVVNWIRISLAALGLPSLSYGFLPMCVPASRLLLFTKMPVILVHNTLLMALFCRDYFCKVFISNKATFWGPGVGTSNYETLGKHNLSCNSKITSSPPLKMTFSHKLHFKEQNVINLQCTLRWEISFFLKRTSLSNLTQSTFQYDSVYVVMVNYILELNAVYVMSLQVLRDIGKQSIFLRLFILEAELQTHRERDRERALPLPG